jgi:multidrug resistance efflux pump
VQEAEAVEKHASTVLDRRRKLGSQGFASQELVDQAEREAVVARQRLQAARQRYALVNDPARDEDVAIAEARVSAAHAARDEAQALLNKSVIRSPIDGTVLRVNHRPGELLTVFLDQPILTVGNLAALYVRAEVDEADIAKVQPGLSAFVTAEAFGQQRFAGRVFRIGQTLGKKKIRTDDPKELNDTKVLEVLIALDSPNPLLPGLRVNAFVMPPRVSARDQGSE